MLSNHSVERQRQHKCNSFAAINSVKPRKIDQAFERYRNAFVLGNLQEQNFIINDLVSSLISTESSKLGEEGKDCMERKAKTSPLEELFKCNLCQDLFHIPVTLICGHTFCLQCLENYQRHDQTTCPGCGHESTLRYSSNISIQELARMWFPEKSEIRYSIAKANKLLSEGRMGEFMEFTNTLLTRYPENVEILYLRANGYRSMKNYSESLRDLDFACSLAPFSEKVLYARGELLACLDESKEAMAMFLRASALKPNDPTYRSSLTLQLEMLLSCSSMACSPNFSCNTAVEFATKSEVKGLPVKSELKFDKSATTARTISRRRQVSHEVQQQFRANFEEPVKTDPTHHRNEATRLNDELLVKNKDSCCEVKETENMAKKQNDSFRSVSQINTTDSSTSNIPTELECNLCFKLIYEPVTTPCGHSLCQPCLRRSLDHRFDCPCCRTNLQQFLEHLMMGSVGTCEVLVRILLLKFNDDYQARKIDYKKELLEFSG